MTGILMRKLIMAIAPIEPSPKMRIYKKPVIVSDIPALREVVIDNKTGIIVPLKDPEGIARAVIKLLLDKKLTKELGENGMNLAKRSYSFKLMLDKLEDLYAGAPKNV